MHNAAGHKSIWQNIHTADNVELNTHLLDPRQMFALSDCKRAIWGLEIAPALSICLKNTTVQTRISIIFGVSTLLRIWNIRTHAHSCCLIVYRTLGFLSCLFLTALRELTLKATSRFWHTWHLAKIHYPYSCFRRLDSTSTVCSLNMQSAGYQGMMMWQLLLLSHMN